jgi:hypothetical protein
MKEISQNIRHHTLNVDIVTLLDEYLNKDYDGPHLDEYEALVVDNVDSSKKGRIQVRVYCLHDKLIPDSDLPWAIPDNIGIGTKQGTICIPEKGDVVYIRFDRGDIYLPKYIIKVLRDNNLPASRKQGYPNNIVYLETSKGTTVNYRRDTDEIKVKHSSGSTIKIDTTGNIEISGLNVDIKHKGIMTIGGSAVTPGIGPLNCIAVCPLTGLPHQGSIVAP